MRVVRRWGAVVLGAVLVSVFGLTGVARANPSGFGWSTSWRYYASNAFEVHVALPGGQADVYGTDSGVARQVLGAVTDTDSRDRYCTRMRVIATDGGQLAAPTTCAGQASFPTSGLFEEAVFVHLDLMSGNTVVKSTFTFVPSAKSDTTLRTINTGTSWFYANGADYHLEVHRPGVDVYGDGAAQGGGARSLLASVVDSGAAGSCVDVIASDASISAGNYACEPGSQSAFGRFDFVGYINVNACYYSPTDAVRCLRLHLPDPY